MKIMIAACLLMVASVAYAHEAPPGTQPASPPKATPDARVVKPVKEHSGGTDARGCHTNSQTGDYHCHKPK